MEGNFIFFPVTVVLMLSGNGKQKGGRESPVERTTSLGAQGSEAVMPHTASHSDFARLCSLE